MSAGAGYAEVMAQRDDIVRASIGLDYVQYATGAIAFDYERLLADTGYDIAAAAAVQRATAVGNTPLVELHNITALLRRLCKPGRGARIFVKDEAANPSGSFKDRRASLSVHEAKRRGYAATTVRRSLRRRPRRDCTVSSCRRRSIAAASRSRRSPRRRAPAKPMARR